MLPWRKAVTYRSLLKNWLPLTTWIQVLSPAGSGSRLSHSREYSSDEPVLGLKRALPDTSTKSESNERPNSTSVLADVNSRVL